MASPSDNKTLYCESGIKQVYLTLQLTSPEEIYYPFADRSCSINVYV